MAADERSSSSTDKAEERPRGRARRRPAPSRIIDNDSDVQAPRARTRGKRKGDGAEAEADAAADNMDDDSDAMAAVEGMLSIHSSQQSNPPDAFSDREREPAELLSTPPVRSASQQFSPSKDLDLLGPALISKLEPLAAADDSTPMLRKHSSSLLGLTDPRPGSLPPSQLSDIDLENTPDV